MSTCNKLGFETLGSHMIMLKKYPKTLGSKVGKGGKGKRKEREVGV